jgi:hypothetical protein
VDEVALLISLASAALAAVTAGLTWWWRRDSQLASITALRTQVLKKQVFHADISSWSPHGIHDSVRELREDLVRSIPTLSLRAALTGERAVESCVEYLLALRPWSQQETEVLAGEHAEVMQHHQAWKAEMQGHLDDLAAQRGHLRRSPGGRQARSIAG